MNNDLVNHRLLPRRAIIVYGEKAAYGSEFYLESREIRHEKGKFIFLAPQPLSKNTMKQIAGSFVQRNSLEMEFGGLVAPHLLLGMNRPGTTAVIWYRPAMKRMLNFSSHLKITGTADVQVPATLYMVLNNTLYAFALLSDDRPTLSTKLHHAPFFNIYKDGNVCLGTAPIGKARARTFEGEANRFERGFYMAEQTGGNNVPCKTDLKKLWAQQIKKGGPFPSKEELVEHPKYKTLDDLISKFIGTNSYGQNQTEAFQEDPEDFDIEEEIEINGIDAL